MKEGQGEGRVIFCPYFPGFVTLLRYSRCSELEAENICELLIWEACSIELTTTNLKLNLCNLQEPYFEH
jgi:hypothetical protein